MIDEIKSYTAKEFLPNDNLFGCLHPSYIYNKNTGHYETVPCKKCTYCVNVEASKQSRRVREEIKQHLYSVMFTLTYDNEYIPRMEAFAGKHGEMQIRPIGRTKELHNCCPFNSKDFNGDYRFNDDTRIPWIEKNKIVWKNNIQFATVSKKDIQNFLKRLRKKIDNLNIPQNEKKIRYYIASEYGPTTLRPHYHGILFIDSAEVLAKIKDFIVDSWGLWVKKKGTFNKYEFKPFADTFLTSDNINICNPNTAFYIAEYVAGNLGLPAVLRERCTRPFHLQSKNPVIGEFKNSKEEVFASIDLGMLRKPTTFTKKDGTQKTVNLLISKDTLSTVFRKCYRYRNLSADSKYHTYNFYSKHIGEWKEYINVKLIEYALTNNIRFNRINLSNYLRRFREDSFRNWCINYKADEYFQLEMDNDTNWYSSKKCYECSKDIDLRRYCNFSDFTSVYLFMFDRYLYLYEQDKLSTFYNTFNNLIEEIGYYSAELECFPMLKQAIPHIKKFTVHGYNLNFDRENRKDINLQPYINYIQRTPFKYWVTPYNFHGYFDDEKFDKEYNPRKTSFFERYKNEQKKKLNIRTKTKKVNNTTVNGVRKMA